MSKELKALLESELLNDETRKALTEAIETMKEKAVEEATASLEVKYAEKLTEEKKRINEGLGKVITESVSSEISELKEDVERYRKLEVEYANRLEEFKQEFKTKLEEGINDVIETQVKSEMDELKEDLQESKKHNMGKRIFESFKEEFESFGFSEDMLSVKEKLDEVSGKLEESENELMQMKRDKKVDELLEDLTGRKREVMKTILENVSYDKLEDRYNQTIDSVLEESTGKDKDNTVKEGDEPETKTVLTESDSEDETFALWGKVLNRNS